MKLKNSKLENEIYDQLNRSIIINGKRNSGDTRIYDLLSIDKPNFKIGLVLAHTPDQGEDFYVILTDDLTIFHIETDRMNIKLPPIFSLSTLQNYKRVLRGKADNIRLQLAMNIIENQQHK